MLIYYQNFRNSFIFQVLTRQQLIYIKNTPRNVLLSSEIRKFFHRKC